MKKANGNALSRGRNAKPTSELGRESMQRKKEEQGGKSRLPLSEQKRVSKSKQFLFEKTLTGIDCEDFFCISTENALAHFPSLWNGKLGNFAKIETLDILHLQSLGNEWRMSFVYSFAHKSYGISTGWNEFVTEYNLKDGDVIDFYKSTYPLHPNLYYIDRHVEGKKTTETENTTKPVEKKTFKMYERDVNYLFEKELTQWDVKWPNFLHIASQEAKEHFPPLTIPEREIYTEKKLLVFDPRRERRQLHICLFFNTYFISKSWEDFASTYTLQEKDVVRFFKIVNNYWCDGEGYLIDFVKAKVDE